MLYSSRARSCRSELWYDGERVRVVLGVGVPGPAGAAALHQHVVLAGEGDGAQGDHQEQVGHVRLHALAVQQVALGLAAGRGTLVSA